MATTENKWLMSEWYWIMANVVLFDNRLTDKQKLLYCLISSLCAEKWYCRASNKYLWEKLWVKEWTISQWVKALIDYWYVESDINKSKWNERHITIANVINQNTYCEKSQEGYCENSQHNITTINTTNENSLLNKEQHSWNQNINELINSIKQECNELWVAYNKDMERQFAKHILTAKEYWEFCEKIWQTRTEFALNVLKVSVAIWYFRWALSWPKAIYKNYAELYNQAKQKAPKLQTPTINVL
jgi:hypothetical protein